MSWKIFNFKPSKAEVEKARETQSANDKAHYKEHIEQAITKNAKEEKSQDPEQIKLARIKEIVDRFQSKKSRPKETVKEVPVRVAEPVKPAPATETPKPAMADVIEPAKPIIIADRFSVVTDVWAPQETVNLPEVYGCPHDAAVHQVNWHNKKRLEQGLIPFRTYLQFMDYETKGIEPDGSTGMEFIDGNFNPKVSSAEVFHIAAEGYKVMRHTTGQVFFLSDGSRSNIPVMLKSTPEGGNPVVTLIPSKGDKSRDLTEQEFNGILSGKPSKEALLRGYSQYHNPEKIEMSATSKTIF